MIEGDLYGKCRACGHVFLVAKLPMEIGRAAALASRAACPACGEAKRIAIARPDEIARAESTP